MSTELVLITPVLLALLGLVVFAGRVGGIQHQVLAAADEGARAASLRDRPALAQADAVEVVRANLADAGVSCRDLDIQVDVTRLHPGGSVRVTVACVVGFEDVALPGLPGQRTHRATATEVVDRYRSGAP